MQEGGRQVCHAAACGNHMGRQSVCMRCLSFDSTRVHLEDKVGAPRAGGLQVDEGADPGRPAALRSEAVRALAPATASPSFSNSISPIGFIKIFEIAVSLRSMHTLNSATGLSQLSRSSVCTLPTFITGW